MPGAFQIGAFQQSPAFQTQISGTGPAGLVTFSLDLEVGGQIEFEWQTDITTTISGLEQRSASLTHPRQRYRFWTTLSEPQWRAAIGTLARTAAAAQPFLFGLHHEDLSIVSSTSTTVVVHSLAFCDWAVAGQRVLVVSPSGETGEAVVQSAAGVTIAVDQDLTSVAVDGARIMPAVSVLLDPEQDLSRYQARMGRWEISAIATMPGFGAATAMGTGATLTTFDGMPVWERGIGGREAAQPLFTGAELVDLGARVSAIGSFDAVQWGRALKTEGSRRSGAWQYLKRFLDTVRGSHQAFLLPTGRPDLVPVGDASSGTLTIDSGVGGTKYIENWFPSLAHRRVCIVLESGARAYRSIVATADNGTTQDLALNAAVAGAIRRVEFLETVRLGDDRGDDRVTVEWGGAQSFSCAMSAQVVQQ